MMTSQEAQALRRTIRALATERLEPEASDVDARSRFPANGYDALVSVGVPALHLPERIGGGGGGILAMTLAVEEIARVCGSTAGVIAATVPATTALSGSAAAVAGHRIEQLAAGDHFSAWIADGVSCTPTAQGMVLNGQGSWVANADRAGQLVVVAEIDAEPEVAVLLVSTDQEGVYVGGVETDFGLRGCSLRSVDLRGVRVAAENLLARGAPARALIDRALTNHRLAVSALAAGVALGALDQARSYLVERQQFGKPIAEFPAIRMILANATVEVDAARQLTRMAAERIDQGTDAPSQASAALLAATEAAATVTIEAVQTFGGYGFIKDYPVERMMRDAHLTRLLVDSRSERRESVAAHFLSGAS